MNDKRFEELLRDAADRYNQPPATPKDEMWTAIQSRRRRPLAQPRRWRRAALWWPAAAAAVLILGIGIGRWSVDAPSPELSQETEPKTSEEFYRLAARRHLEQTETLLTLFTLDDPSGLDEGRFDGRARKLLAETRLLLDSPAAKDPTMRALFADLELVLARIVYASGEHAESEQERLRDDPIFLKLRTQLPAGRV